MVIPEESLPQAIFSFSHPDLTSPASSRPIYVPPPALSQHNLTLPLHDIRSVSELQQGLKSLDEHGFTLVKHASAFEEDREMQGMLKGRNVEEGYAPEMVELALKVTGAERAVVHNVAFRRRGSEGEAEEEERRGETESAVNVNGRTQADAQQPARHAHIDLTLQGLRDTLRLARSDITAAAQSVIDAEEAQARGEEVVVPRFAAYSLWRPLKTVRRDPLTLLDSQTLSPSDIVATTNRIPSSYSKSSLPDNPNLLADGTYIVSAYTALPPKDPEQQKWYWAPEQKVDEVLIIKFADSWGGEAGEVVGEVSAGLALSISTTQRPPTVMEDHNLAADAGQQKQHFTSPAPLTSTSAPPLRRSKRIKNAIQSSNASPGAVKRKRKRPLSADAVSRPAAKSAKTNSKSRRNDLPSQSQRKKARNTESDETSGVASQNSSSIASIPHGEQPFRLFDLPDELWVKIGQMATEDLPAIELFLPDRHPSSHHELSTLSSKLKTPAILQSCSALRKELRLHYYGSNKIRVTIDELSAVGSLRPYLQAIGSNARRLLDDFTMMGRVHWEADAVLEPPHDLPASWGVELVLSLISRDPCEGCEADHVDWKITFQ
ncbi:hypothetical protein TI39_contig4414g00001 [Zymoseptoria brevis]|uniref:Uncharacterized protein n=1 Tax=Zymoseptoria brevis TaxID=1047168 RepID=A0A0F4G7W1_9PEZI|nr:hypothetical protein TI39_contig4414g00001 [Zymoseptoria brevis]